MLFHFRNKLANLNFFSTDFPPNCKRVVSLVRLARQAEIKDKMYNEFTHFAPHIPRCIYAER